MLRLLSLRRLPWVADTDGQEKVDAIALLYTIFLIFQFVDVNCNNYCYFFGLQVVLSAVEVASLRSEINDLEERESHLKAQ